MCKLDELRAKRNEIYRIVKAHKEEKLFVFGSCARKEETPESDVNFLVEFAKGATLFNQFDFKDELSELIHSPVDVVSIRTLNDDAFSREVKKDMVAL